tara:strand:- start:686 stop:4543 length:3858 start_codon:yes stop_codon:yes gene_type:complete
MAAENLITKDPFYESDFFRKVAEKSGAIKLLDSESYFNSRYKDAQGNIRGYTPRQILESGGPKSNVVQEVERKRGNRTYSEKVALSNPEFFQFASVLEQVLDNPDLLRDVTENLGVDESKLRSDYEAVEPVYSAMWSRIKNNKSSAGLTTSDYERREQGEEPLVPPGVAATSGVLGYAISQGAEMLRGGLFESNEDQREALILRGVNPSFVENSYEEYAPIDEDYFYRVGVSPIFSTPTEYKNIIRKFDPDAKVEYINPDIPEEGLLVKSRFNPFIRGEGESAGDYAWLPVANVQPMESMLEGDISPALRELAKFGAQEGVGITAGGGAVTLAGKLARKKIQERLQRKAKDIDDPGASRYRAETAKIPGKISIPESLKEIGYTSLGVAGGEALVRFGQLALGTTEAGGNVQPDLQFERAVEDSGAIFQAALLYGAGGDVLIRSLGAMWTKLTGRPVQSEIIDEMMVEARVLGDKIRRVNDGNADALPEEMTPQMRDRIAEVARDPETGLVDLPEFDELTPGELLKLTGDAADEAARRIRQQKQTLGQLSENERILAFEELMSEVMLEMPIAIDLEDFHKNNSAMLEQFYRDILRKSGLNPREAEELGVSKETLNEVFSGVRVEQLVKELSEEEQAIVDKMVGNQLGQMLASDTSRAGRQQAAENIQERVKTAQSKFFPDEKSRLIVQRSEELDEIRSKMGGILSRDQYNDQRATVKLPKYISAPLKDFLDANKQEGVVFGSEDTAEAAEFIRAILPNRETEGISIQMMLGQGRDEKGQFLPQKPFTQKELILTRQNLAAALSGHPNKVVREKGEALLAGIDNAIDDNFRKMYKIQTGKDAPENMEKLYDEVGREYQILAGQLVDKQQELSARFLVDLAKKDESEIGSFIRTSNPGNVRSLMEFVSRQEGGLEKIESIKTTVLESIKREVDADNVNPGTARSRFNNILSKNEEQLRALFPEDFVKFEDYRSFLSEAQKAVTKSQSNIRAINRELENLKDETGKARTLTEVLDQYFNLSARGTKNVQETQLSNFVKNIGKTAEDYPELRTALQQYFAENIVLGLRGTAFRKTPRGTRMLDAAGPDSSFDITRLKELILEPFSTDADAARFLEPVVGADEAFRYAKDLRILARMVNQQKGFAGNPLESYLGKQARKNVDDVRSRGQGTRGGIDRIRRFIFGPLDLTATRIGVARDVFAEELDGAKAVYLGKIVSDPTKLKAYLRAEQMKLPALTMFHVTQAIAQGRSENVGSEENQTARDRMIRELSNLTEEQNTMPERIMRLYEELF